jgi:hypothetical protein
MLKIYFKIYVYKLYFFNIFNKIILLLLRLGYVSLQKMDYRIIKLNFFNAKHAIKTTHFISFSKYVNNVPKVVTKIIIYNL